jgi:cholinesterase
MLTGMMNNEAGMWRLMRNVSDEDMPRLNLCFNCPASYSSKARVDFNVTTWRYRYFGDWENIRPTKDAGAFHGSELSIVFGTPKKFESKYPSPPEEVAVEKLMMGAWANFAKDPVNGLIRMGWPSYDPKGTSLDCRMNCGNLLTLLL